MAAKDYELVVAALSGQVYLTRTSKKNTGVMSNDREIIPKSKFIGAIMEFVNGQIPKDQDTLSITVAGDVVAEIKLFRDKLFKDTGLKSK